MIDVPSEVLSIFPPSVDALLDFTRYHVDNAMLDDIARADYGIGADEVYPLLRIIRDRGTIPEPVPSQLHEVLTLMVLHDPARPNPPPFRPGPVGLRGHQTRLFVCAVRMTAATLPAARFDEDIADSMLASSIASACELGEEAIFPTGRALTHQAGQRCSEPILLAMGILVLALRLPRDRVDERVLEMLADWVLSIENSIQQFHQAYGFHAEHIMPFSVAQRMWNHSRDDLQRAAQQATSENLKEALQLCSLLISPGW